MPTVNIPPRVRFLLYLAGTIGIPLVIYAKEKGWIGAPEIRLAMSWAALLATLAAAKTDLSGDETEPNPRRQLLDNKGIQ